MTGPRVAVLMLAAALVAYWIGQRHPLSGAALDPPAVLRETKKLKQLVTMRYTIQKVIGLKEKRAAMAEESLLLIVQGHVLGGVDLAHLDAGDIHVVNSHEIRIKLPPAQVLEVSTDEKETKVWDRRISWWAPWAADPDMEHRARLAALEAIKQAALDMGLIRDARQQAESALEELFSGQGVHVGFEPPQT